MNQQLLDFDRPAQGRTKCSSAPLSNAERFARLMQEHPEVYRAFLAYARQWQAAGHRRCSADMILHRLRWETGISTRGDDSGWKLNNVMTPFLARKAIADHPAEFSGFFETRRQKSQ